MTNGDNSGSGPNGPPTTPPATGDATANTRGAGTGTEETHVPVRPDAPGEDTEARIRVLQLGRELDNRQIEALGAEIDEKNGEIKRLLEAGVEEGRIWSRRKQRLKKVFAGVRTKMNSLTDSNERLQGIIKERDNALAWYKGLLKGAIVAIIILIIALIANCNGCGSNVDTDCGPMITKKNQEISGKLARCEVMLERVRAGFRASVEKLEAATSTTGDPFTAEAVIGDPRRQLTAEELDNLCHSSDAGVIAVKKKAEPAKPPPGEKKKKKKKVVKEDDLIDTSLNKLGGAVGPTGPAGPAGPPGPAGGVIVIPGGTPPVDPPPPPPSAPPAAVININIAEREAYQKCASLKDRVACCIKVVDELTEGMTARKRRQADAEMFRKCTGFTPLTSNNGPTDGQEGE